MLKYIAAAVGSHRCNRFKCPPHALPLLGGGSSTNRRLHQNLQMPSSSAADRQLRQTKHTCFPLHKYVFFLSFSKGGKKGVIIYCKKYATLIPSNLSQKKVGDFFLILSGTYTIVPTVLPASPYIESEAAGRKSDYAQQEQQHEQQRSSSSSADRKWGRATGASGQESRVYRMNTTAVLVVVNINSVGITAYTRLR